MPLYFFVATMHLFSQSLSIVLRCESLLLNVIISQVYSVARLCSDQSFLSLFHRHHVAALSMLYKINSNSNHCDTWKYQGVERPNFYGVSCRPRLVCGMTFLTLCLTPER